MVTAREEDDCLREINENKDYIEEIERESNAKLSWYYQEGQIKVKKE